MVNKEAEFIRNFLDGDPPAVRQVELWIAGAGKAFRGRLGGEWEDLRQDILLEVTRLFSEGRFRGESAPVSYVWRITNHACIRKIRQVNRWAPDVAALLDRQIDKRQTAAERLLEQDRLASIRRIVMQMSEECKELWRRVLAGQSYQTMSAELGIAEGALRVKALRCRRKALSLRDSDTGAIER